MSTDRLDKENVVHICNGIVLSHKKERNNAICSNMDGPKSEKDKYHDNTYMWNPKKMIQMNLFTKQK